MIVVEKIQLGKYLLYERSAYKRGIKFNLTILEFLRLWGATCVYCGEKIETIGIDRVDSRLNYTPDNIIPSCTACNRMKMISPSLRFVEKCKKIANNSEGIEERINKWKDTLSNIEEIENEDETNKIITRGVQF